MLDAVERYLGMRARLGYIDEDLTRDLRSFASFTSSRGSVCVRVSDALDWVAQRTDSARRFALLAAVRRLGLYLRAEDVNHELVPEEYTKAPKRDTRKPPFIYTEEEIAQLMDMFERISIRHPIDRLTYRNIIGLIATTGLRISEALALKQDDLREHMLFVRKGKFGKDRLIYLHETTVAALQAYRRARPQDLDSKDFFVIHTNRAPSAVSVLSKFRRCADFLVMNGRFGSARPRIHDLRHAFIVRSLSDCEFSRDKVSSHAVAVANYVGHVSMASTYWYSDIDLPTKVRMADAIEASMNV